MVDLSWKVPGLVGLTWLALAAGCQTDAPPAHSGQTEGVPAGQADAGGSGEVADLPDGTGPVPDGGEVGAVPVPRSGTHDMPRAVRRDPGSNPESTGGEAGADATPSAAGERADATIGLVGGTVEAPAPPGRQERETEAASHLAPMDGGIHTADGELTAGGPAVGGPAVVSGTRIPVVLEGGISTRSHRPGHAIMATVTEEILAPDGLVLIPEGSRVEGWVEESRESPGPDEPAILTVSFTSIEIEDRSHPIRARMAAGGVQVDTRDGRSRSAAGTAAGAAVAATTRDGHAVIEEGALLTIELEETLRLVRER